MATDGPTSASARFDDYRRIAAEYRACVLRCQQAIDQLQACERDANALNDGQPLASPGPHFEIDKAIAQLSQREFEVFSLISRGLTTLQIARELQITNSTVETYRERLKSKLNIRSAPALIREAVLWAYRNP